MHIWGFIKYALFLGLFFSILLSFWTYSYTPSTDLPAETADYPYRSSTFTIITVAVLLFVMYVYTVIQSHKNEKPSQTVSE